MQEVLLEPKQKTQNTVRYWVLQSVLSKAKHLLCDRCAGRWMCWSHEGCVFSPDDIRKTCGSDVVKQVVSELEEIALKQNPLDFGLSADDARELKKRGLDLSEVGF